MEDKNICFDNFWVCFGFYKTECISFNILPIEPSKAICNIDAHDNLTEENKKFLEQFKFDVEKLGCPVMHEKRKYYYTKFKPTRVSYFKDGVKHNIDFEWDG